MCIHCIVDGKNFQLKIISVYQPVHNQYTVGILVYWQKFYSHLIYTLTYSLIYLQQMRYCVCAQK